MCLRKTKSNVSTLLCLLRSAVGACVRACARAGEGSDLCFLVNSIKFELLEIERMRVPSRCSLFASPHSCHRLLTDAAAAAALSRSSAVEVGICFSFSLPHRNGKEHKKQHQLRCKLRSVSAGERLRAESSCSDSPHFKAIQQHINFVLHRLRLVNSEKYIRNMEFSPYSALAAPSAVLVMLAP